MAAIVAVTVTTMLAGRVAATDGWLDPTFSGDGWVRLPEGAGAAADLVVLTGPSGRTIVGRMGNRDGSPVIEALVLTPAGAPSSTFNDGGWRTFVSGAHDTLMLGFSATPSGGAVAALGPYHDGVLRIREVGPDGATIRGAEHAIVGDGFLNANVVRLPGGSLRTCSWDETSDEHRLLGFTPALALDPAVGPDGQRALPMDNCLAIGADAVGHVYLAESPPVLPEELPRVELIRATTSGVVDTAWSGDGRAALEFPGIAIHMPREIQAGIKQFSPAASPILPQPDGSVFIVARITREGTHTRSAAIIKLTPDGELDPSFSGDGMRAFAPPGGQSRILAMAVDQAGRPVLSFIYSYANGNSRGFLGRLTADGSFDPTFGRQGVIQQTFTADSLLIDAQGRIVTAARESLGPQARIIVARRNG